MRWFERRAQFKKKTTKNRTCFIHTTTADYEQAVGRVVGSVESPGNGALSITLDQLRAYGRNGYRGDEEI